MKNIDFPYVKIPDYEFLVWLKWYPKNPNSEVIEGIKDVNFNYRT